MKRSLLAAASLIAISTASPSHAAFEPFLGEIMLVGFGFCPTGWIDAAGQIVGINTNQALFALYGTTYGGNGVQTFGIPDLRGRIPLNQGAGPGVPAYTQGQIGGSNQVTLNVQQLPPHNHILSGSTDPADTGTIQGNAFANLAVGTKVYDTSGTLNTTFNPNSIQPTGGGMPVTVTNPYLVIRYCVATSGIFPSRP